MSSDNNFEALLEPEFSNDGYNEEIDVLNPSDDENIDAAGAEY
jgi:hypothetical protein